MKYLVTGAGGYIGAHLIYALRNTNSEILALTGKSQFSENRAKFLDLKHHSLDLLDTEKVRQTVNDFCPDVIVHLAALKSPTESNLKPNLYMTNNLKSLENLANAGVMSGARAFIHASSSSVYGNLNSNSIKETDKGIPLSFYGLSKRNAEEFLDTNLQANFMPAISLRFFNVIGSEHNSLADKANFHLIPATLNRLRNKESPILMGDTFLTQDGSAIRDYIHVSDAIRAIIQSVDFLLATQSPIKHISINVGSGIGTSVLEIFGILKNVLHTEFEIIRQSARDGDPANVVANIEKMKQLLDFEPSKDLEQMIKTCI